MGWSDELTAAAPASAPASWADELAASTHPQAVAPITPAHAAIAAKIANDAVSRDAKAGPSLLGELAGQVGNLFAGGVRGAGSIGATLMYPVDKAQDLYYGDRGPNVTSIVTGKQSVSRNQERRQDMDAALATLGADTASPAYKVGKLGAEIAGTSGVGGVLVNGARAIVPASAAASPVGSALLDSLASGGFSVGSGTGNAVANVGVRALGGGVNGATASGLVNPDDAGKGALIGAVLPLGAQALGKTLQGVGNLANWGIGHGLGTTTGAGSDAISTAYQAGKEGSSAFLDNLRGKVPFADIVDQAKGGIANLRAARSQAYQDGMQGLSADKTVLDMQPVTNAIDRVTSTGFYKGQRINSSAADTLEAIDQQVKQWSALDPKEFHTAEGFDALKRSIGDIRDATQFGTPARRAADDAYNAVKGQIVKQAPDYAKTMSDYSEASNQIDEITKGLSLGDKASADTAIRKLQSVMRNNAQTNYGNRLALVDALKTDGGVDLNSALAGQALNSWTPRGMVGSMEKTGGVAAALLNPKLLAAAPLMSPRLMGELAYGSGRLASRIDPRALGQTLMGAGVNPQTLLSSNDPKAIALAQALMSHAASLAPSVAQ
jgi:hypothetical protein